MYYVYILYNRDREFRYVGLTKDLEKRLKEHKAGLSPVTKGYLPIRLVWYAVFSDKSIAARFERYLKSGSGRAFVKRHILLV